MKTLASLRALAAILFCGAGLPAQDPASDPLRFLHVEKYQGRFVLSATGAGSIDIDGSHINYSMDRHVNLSFEMTAGLPDNVIVQEWSGILDGTSSASFHDQTITTGAGCVSTTTSDGEGALTFSPDETYLRFELALDVLGGELQPLFDFPGVLDTLDHTVLSGGAACPKDDYTSQTTYYPFPKYLVLPNCPDFSGLPIECLDLPAEGVLIQQTWDFDFEEFPLDYGMFVPIHYSITLELDGDLEDLEVVVTPDDYTNWLPQAKASESEEGNTIQINAKLQKKGGGTPKKHAEQFIFELTQSSQEPGVCLNYPVKGAKSSPDLAFTSKNNKGNWMPVSPSGDSRIETIIGSFVDSPPAVVSSFDWGAFGAIKVRAVLEGGRVIEGHLEGDEAVKEIRLPKRDENSKIGDKWKSDNPGAGGKADDADDEAVPAGDGHAGDGLTLYEEYRGFYMHSTGPEGHVSGEPKQKDLFVNDRTASGTALHRFQSLTGLAVHYDLAKDYLNGDREINPNHGTGPHVVDQHALIVEKVKLESGIAGRAQGGPGLPVSVSRVFIGDSLDPKAIRTLDRGATTYLRSDHLSTVVHELLHACNVYHHGEVDRPSVSWTPAMDNGYLTIHEEGKVIRLFNENNQELQLDGR